MRITPSTGWTQGAIVTAPESIIPVYSGSGAFGKTDRRVWE
jgi:hypothetical protein